MPTHVLQSMNLVSKTVLLYYYGNVWGHVLKRVLTWSRAPSLLSVWIGTVGGSLGGSLYMMMRRTGNRGPGGVCTRGVCSNSLSALLLLDCLNCGNRLCPWGEEWGVVRREGWHQLPPTIHTVFNRKRSIGFPCMDQNGRTVCKWLNLNRCNHQMDHVEMNS